MLGGALRGPLEGPIVCAVPSPVATFVRKRTNTAVAKRALP
jgi:hypothetical protein